MNIRASLLLAGLAIAQDTAETTAPSIVIATAPGPAKLRIPASTGEVGPETSSSVEIPRGPGPVVLSTHFAPTEATETAVASANAANTVGIRIANILLALL